MKPSSCRVAYAFCTVRMLMCNDFASDRTEGIASPAFNSPLIIAALICEAICSYRGRLTLLLTTNSKESPPFPFQLYYCYKYSITQKRTVVKMETACCRIKTVLAMRPIHWPGLHNRLFAGK